MAEVKLVLVRPRAVKMVPREAGFTMVDGVTGDGVSVEDVVKAFLAGHLAVVGQDEKVETKKPARRTRLKNDAQDGAGE